ncbi:unnamed protein product [Polarella glacialis]|uniref:Uncharacterized protein n=1 Tax=Polarella glacialis TaxID=89957 RepID=A0A813FIN9_POLGL|nr:unnamed protein product [Polarella glacialis]
MPMKLAVLRDETVPYNFPLQEEVDITSIWESAAGLAGSQHVSSHEYRILLHGVHQHIATATAEFIQEAQRARGKTMSANGPASCKRFKKRFWTWLWVVAVGLQHDNSRFYPTLTECLPNTIVTAISVNSQQVQIVGLQRWDATRFVTSSQCNVQQGRNFCWSDV